MRQFLSKIRALTLWEWIATLAFVTFFVWHLGSNLPVGERRYRQCIVCRVLHIKHSYCGYRWETERENACTAWVRKTDPAHKHVWVNCSSPFASQNLFGQTIEVPSSSVDYRPAQRLTPEQQVAVYEHIGDFQEAQEFFATLRDSLKSQRSWSRCVAASLVDWAERDQFQTPWPVWREKMYAECAPARE